MLKALQVVLFMLHQTHLFSCCLFSKFCILDSCIYLSISYHLPYSWISRQCSLTCQAFGLLHSTYALHLVLPLASLRIIPISLYSYWRLLTKGQTLVHIYQRVPRQHQHQPATDQPGVRSTICLSPDASGVLALLKAGKLIDRCDDLIEGIHRSLPPRLRETS